MFWIGFVYIFYIWRERSLLQGNLAKAQELQQKLQHLPLKKECPLKEDSSMVERGSL